MLAHRERTWRTPRWAGSRQHSGPVSGGGPGKATPKEALGPSSQPWGSPRAVSSWGTVSHAGPPQEPRNMAPPGVHTSAPALGSRPPQAAVVPRPTAGPPEAHGPRGIYIPVCPQPAPAAVTLSLSARGTGPRAGQRFRAALTKLLSWEWATHQTSGPALVSPGRWLDTAGHPRSLFSVWQCLPPATAPRQESP